MKNILVREFFPASELKDAILIFMISKEEVITQNIERFQKQILEFRKIGSHGKDSLEVIFDGYDDDTRELFEIPEIREYVRLLFNYYPGFFYFLSDAAKQLFLFCLLELDKVENNPATDTVRITFSYNFDNLQIILAIKQFCSLIENS